MLQYTDIRTVVKGLFGLHYAYISGYSVYRLWLCGFVLMTAFAQQNCKFNVILYFG